MKLLERYRDDLPVSARTPLLSLGEGQTPLVPARRISETLGLDLYLKFEGQNPTGSFKDRGMVLAVAKAIEEGSRAVICASTGNTSASAAAYAAQAGIRAVVVVPQGRIALGKLAQAVMYGAEVLAIDGNFDEALRMVRQIAAKEPFTLVNSLNPYRIEGQQTAAFEVVDELGRQPDLLAIPVGNAGNITAWNKGFRRRFETGRTSGRPQLLGFQAAGAAPIVGGAPVAAPETVASAIRIGNPASWHAAVAAVEESGGGFWAVSDEEILAAQSLIASSAGVFCEPASAASVAGLLKLRRLGHALPGQTAVAVLTGNGLKDPDTALRNAGADAIREIPADLSRLREALGL